mmetsp:Transcript_57779/g.118246  ORF Transcript_57779/g.118246 Transcript_57779/m.118246 type:complete len:271 (+) Transcript_57779:38-850(+)|eukprot:CAMPEP_0181289690 /NCGR_PEP_ID=MMETSP1101-20121128/1016_1 /TAXON_ID=46948 /ORGANISM="Rhodomonas abbreviata, Strain Caron Lab Isolate" /LENGTH=270 /DNA_ID=CAMNT_0023393927 /DNA_START=37 /DNA_END=849 /DNA_ORIENTATION=+
MWKLLLVGSSYLLFQLYANYKRVTTSRKKPVLHSLKLSHYVEKARWTLDLLEEDYEENCSYAVLGVFLAGRTLPALELAPRTILGDSDEILTYMRGKHPRGNFLHAELNAEQQQLLAGMNVFGQNVRRFVYGYFLPGSPKLVKQFWRAGTGRLATVLGDVVLFPVAKFLIVPMLRIYPSGIDRSKTQVDEVLDQIDALLADGREYLNGKQLSELDIVFCSLIAPMVLEQNYGGATLPTLAELDAKSQAVLAPYQDRPFAKYCHAIYKKHR